METLNALKAYYGSYDENNRLCSRHGMVEYLTTMKFIDRYLSPGMRILEIGAGTGRYSHALARRGYRVDAVELVERNVQILKAHTEPGENISVMEGNAKDLSVFGDNTFDMTLLLGPMYHLFTQEEQLQALAEAVRVTKKGGIIFAAYCMEDPSILMYGFMKGNIHSLMEKKLLDPVTFETRSTPQELFQLYRKADIDRLRSCFPVTQLHFVAADGYTNHMRETVDQMDDATFDIYLRYHFAVCQRQELVGYSHHTLDIFRKE